MTLLCFMPYYVSPFIGQEVSNEDLTGYILLFYCNSTINPIVYAFFTPGLETQLNSLSAAIL